MRRPSSTWIAVALLATACSGSTTDAADAAIEPADGGTTDEPTAGAAADASPEAGEGGTEAAPDGTETCTRTDDAAVLVWVDGATRMECAGLASDAGTLPLIDLDVEVTGATADTLTLNTCSPMMSCVHAVELHVTAPGLVLSDAVPMHAYAHVTLSIRRWFSCYATLLVRSIPSWAGAANPAGTGDAVLVAAVEGGGVMPADAPFETQGLALGCSASPYPTCGDAPPPDDYALQVREKGAATWVTVYMGHTEPFAIGGHGYHARDLRSFNVGACHEADRAFWIARDP